jgi:O-6-methylguanine DNA methyltransferase
MNGQMRYTIFNTAWGYFGFVANEKGIIRTCLPCPSRHKRRRASPDRKTVENRLLAGLDSPRFDKNLLKPLQKQIIAYFAGKRPLRPLFSVVCPLHLSGLTPFTRKVLTACSKIPSGKTVSYSQLAGMIGKPRASRTVGSALAKNPIPLIIPCHRVIHSDGSLGNFSAPGRTITKKKLIALENNER